MSVALFFKLMVQQKRFQKVIVEHTYDDSFVQKCSIQYVSLAVNCSFIASWVFIQSPLWERQHRLVKRQETLQSIIVWISVPLFTITAMWPPQKDLNFIFVELGMILVAQGVIKSCIKTYKCLVQHLGHRHSRNDDHLSWFEFSRSRF